MGVVQLTSTNTAESIRMLLSVVVILSVAAVSTAEYTNLGCWRNKIPQAVTRLEGSDGRLDRFDYRRRDDAVNKCHEVAKDQGYDFFGVGNKGQCWAGNGDAYQEYGLSQSCPENGKGSYGVINVYSIVPDTTTVEQVCGGHIWEASGTIRSPGFPNNYPTNKQCTWVIYATNNQPIRIKFTDFKLESPRSCSYAYLEVRNGGSPRSPLIGKFCGSNELSFSSKSDAIFLRFRSDMSSTDLGFSLNFDQDNSCYSGSGSDYNGTLITTSSGTICQRWDGDSPLSPSSRYPNSADFPGINDIADANNYCRNPKDGSQPWCYTSDADMRWDYCGVNRC